MSEEIDVSKIKLHFDYGHNSMDLCVDTQSIAKFNREQDGWEWPTKEFSMAMGERIVECVNACAGIPSEELNRRQEAKPLTVEDILKIMWDIKTGWHSNRISLAIIGKFSEAIQAALPPDQSARIAELEATVEKMASELHEYRLSDAFDQSQKVINQLQADRDALIKCIEAQGADYPDGQKCYCSMAIGHPSFSSHTNQCTETRQLIARIKAGQS